MGENYEAADDRRKKLARLMINSGAVMVIDGHPPVTHMDDEGSPHLQRETASPSGQRGSDKIENRRALIDSPFSR